MFHRPRAIPALLAALLLTAAMPAAAMHAAAGTPLNTNLLHNGGFELLNSDGSLRYWKSEGSVRTETFGTRAWPYPAYGRKYNGGKRYLTCGTGSALVRQTVDFNGTITKASPLQAKVQTNFGGTTGHRIRVSIRATGSAPDRYAEKLKTLEITNHYKVAVASIRLPIGTRHIEATVELLPKVGASKCKMVADTVKVLVFRP